MNLVYVFIGGGIGCVTRYVFSVFFTRMQFTGFPWSTLAANVVSCIVFGLALFFLGAERTFSSNSMMRPLLLTGFCGGLSTFSTFSFETFELLRRGDYTMAGANVLVNMVLCLAIFVFLAKSSD